ncbi:hypothetical protein SUDANB95_07916 (plasmid) [Actinosynnema sp. ALI-1.44]
MTNPPPNALTRAAVLSGEIVLNPQTRWRYGARDDAEATQAHNVQTREWRRSLRDVEFSAKRQQLLLTLLPEHPDVGEAAGLIGLTGAIVYGRMRRDSKFAKAVEDLLAAHCRGGNLCGKATGYKLGGRCRRCRSASKAPAKGVRKFNRPRRKRTAATA